MTASPKGELPAPSTRRVRNWGALAALLAVGMALLLLVPAAPEPSSTMHAAPEQALLLAKNAAAVYGLSNAITTSALTLRGTGDYSDLQVTVGQTKNLVNQSIVVTWAWGGTNAGQHATIRSGSTPVANYLQLMQCWGDGGPERTQCEFGGLASIQQSGQTYSASRRIFPPGDNTPPGPVDPAEPTMAPGDAQYRNYQFNSQPNGSFQGRAVPFRSVTGEVFRHDAPNPVANPFYDEYQTNEVPYGITRGDGRGFETFETLTYRESTGLGCAQVRTTNPGKGTPRNCWLVIVPRGTTEVNGQPYTVAGANAQPPQLLSSPLSATNWAHRIAFPLGFAPVGQPCPLSAQQRLVGGVETSQQAVLRWQPALCQNGGPVFGYSKLADAVAEGPLVGTGDTSRGLSFLNAPVDPSSLPADRSAVYAPIAVSGITIAALVEETPSTAAPELEPSRGQRVTDINLTPRLVAKLLTQSYVASVESDRSRPLGYLAGNPYNIDSDPDFLAVNPLFKKLQTNSLQIMLPSGVSYSRQVLWNWIATDEDARDFVAGVPDPWKMRVNPFYQGLQIPQETLPKIDPYCRRDHSTFKLPQLCAFDLHPVVADFQEAARAVGRGDTLALQWPTFTSKPLPTDSLYAKAPREVSGSRQMLGITDSATAALFQLNAVKLRNASGQFVAPTASTMLAAVSAMTPSVVPGVLTPNPRTAVKNAYPLTVITYAASTPNKLTAAAARDYANFVRYAAGPGQTIGEAFGQLPEGYAPLPTALRQQALRAAADIQNRVGPPLKPVGPPTHTSGSGAGPAAPPVSPAATPPAGAVPSPSVVALPQTKPSVARTPADALIGWAGRYVFIAALTLGLVGLLIGPFLPRLAQRIRR